MYSILVNSTDRYSDCWQPFFYLLNKYFKDINCSVYLNCEKLTFEGEGIPVQMIRNSEKFTWSQCLINAIHQIDSPIILYLQDDYFLDAPVDKETFDDFINLMIKNPEIKHIGLTKIGSPASPVEYPKDRRLKIIKQNTKYRISMQAALWNKDCLLSYLQTDENAWMLEIFGSRRAAKRNDLLLTISDFHYINKGVINYTGTGIIKGKWHKDIPKFFSEENIVVDFSIRGTIDPYKNVLLNKFQTLKKVLSVPSKIKHFLPWRYW